MKRVFKKLTAVVCLILTLIIAFAFSGCNSGFNGGDMASGVMGGAPSGSPADKGEMFPSGDDMLDRPDAVDPDGVEGGGNSSQKPVVKQLTAAEWRDAHNYKFWLSLFNEGKPAEDPEQSIQDGIFHDYYTSPRGLDTSLMHEVHVTYDGSPAGGAAVKLYDENTPVYSAVTDSTGTAYVFGDGTKIEAVSGEYSAYADVADGVIEIELENYAACSDELEIMLVVDTTGSMGDELSFLCDELAGVVTRVSSILDCDIRLGLLFYRDAGDEYLTRKFDFVEVTSTSGLNTVVGNIKKQKASGGDDYPEAVDTALSEAVTMNWHTNSKTRLLFHVLDAPYHDTQEKQSNFANAVKTAAEKGIRIIPVAASGLDTLGQYIMRSAALLTGGTYAFLTDDSGIGESHELPVVGEYTVEYLNDLMVRLINGFYTGTFDDPIPWFESENVA